jgi:hypothetical protein
VLRIFVILLLALPLRGILQIAVPLYVETSCTKFRHILFNDYSDKNIGYFGNLREWSLTISKRNEC